MLIREAFELDVWGTRLTAWFPTRRYPAKDPKLPETSPTISGEPLPPTNLGTLSTEIENTFLKSPWPP
jgi:hypothetical protein